MPLPPSVVLSDHSPGWAPDFHKERARIASALAPYALAIEHTGGTAVPGLAAKATIDITVGIYRLEDAPRCVERMAAIGYTYVPEFEAETPERRYFRIRAPGSHPAEDLYHVHLVEAGGPWFERDVLFRDYLKGHPETAREYEVLKRTLAAQHGSDRNGYTDGKAPFVSKVVELARAELAAASVKRTGGAAAATPPQGSGGPPPPNSPP